MQVGKIMTEADMILYTSSYSIGPIYNARVMSDVNVLVRVQQMSVIVHSTCVLNTCPTAESWTVVNIVLVLILCVLIICLVQQGLNMRRVNMLPLVNLFTGENLVYLIQLLCKFHPMFSTYVLISIHNLVQRLTVVQNALYFGSKPNTQDVVI